MFVSPSLATMVRCAARDLLPLPHCSSVELHDGHRALGRSPRRRRQRGLHRTSLENEVVDALNSLAVSRQARAPSCPVVVFPQSRGCSCFGWRASHAGLLVHCAHADIFFPDVLCFRNVWMYERRTASARTDSPFQCLETEKHQTLGLGVNHSSCCPIHARACISVCCLADQLWRIRGGRCLMDTHVFLHQAFSHQL